MAKYNKKGKNLCAVDGWLDNLGFYRKNVAYDETCLFRAVSEQLYNCQIYHERVRKECIAYARINSQKFLHLNVSESREMWEERLERLENHMLFCGPMELQVVSKKYRRDIVIFDGNKQEVLKITHNYPDTLFLCLMEEDHYDAVYTKEHIINAGFCQSIVYKIFYEEVFQIENVDEIVRNMLYEKHNLITPDYSKCKEENSDPIENNMIAPFPFKVAKALDPNIYRNIEYDSWGDTRRELRLGEWYYGDDKLILGTKCLFHDARSRQTFECYIQEKKNQDTCVIFLTKTAEKLTVNYSDLSPENDAKPWPLPYRFTKNNLCNNTQVPPHEDRTHKYKKRNKDKKRTKSESCINVLGTNLDPLENVNAYVGVPLQMQNMDTTSCQTPVVSIECQTDPLVQEPMNHSPQWQFIPPSPDPFVWPPPTTVPPQQFNLGLKPMIASAPVTPDVVPYHDPQYPYYYNYHVDPYMYNQNWSTTMETPADPQRSDNDIEEQAAGIKLEMNHELNNPVSPQKLKLCTNLTPPSSSMEIYSPILQIPPGTPVVYTPMPIPESDVLMQTPQMVYNPQMEMSYIPPPPYIYPPTPPTAWYPQGVNAQGFIFP